VDKQHRVNSRLNVTVFIEELEEQEKTCHKKEAKVTEDASTM
jgi:hypothetical protein